jgi:hypothetical protein
VSRLSPLTLPFTTLRLAGRFGVPLVLWFTVGEALRYLLLLAGYHYGLHNAVLPILVLSLSIMVSLAVTVAMLHSVRDGLAAVRARDLDEHIAPWAADHDEGIMDAVTRALLPFMIFYLAWGWFSEDAKAFVQSAAGRGAAEGGITGELDAMKIIIGLLDHTYVAIACTVGFFTLKILADRLVEPRWPRIGKIAIAYCEVNWTLFALFTIDVLRRGIGSWITGRVAWAELGHLSGPVLGWLGTSWPLFKDAVLGALVWLVIAGVVLGVDAEEEAALGKGRLGRRIIRASGIDKPRRPREVLTRELRDKWLPTVYGFRMVFRAGMVPFGVFCALFAGLEVLDPLTKRGAYYVLGPHEIGWWEPRLGLIALVVALVHDVLRVCLMAAAFNLVVVRVSARTAAPVGVPSSVPPMPPLVPPARPY